jgi:hypothetical protein
VNRNGTRPDGAVLKLPRSGCCRLASLSAVTAYPYLVPGRSPHTVAWYVQTVSPFSPSV